MNDKDIQDLLDYIYNNEHQFLPWNLDSNDVKDIEFLNNLKEIIKFEYLEYDLKLLNSKVIEGDLVAYYLTSLSREIIRNGGWIEYQKNIDKNNERKIRKEISELKISEFQSKNPRLPYFISICGVIISLLVFVKSCIKDNKESHQKTTKYKQNIIEKKQKDSTLSIHQKEYIYTKNIDSLKLNKK